MLNVSATNNKFVPQIAVQIFLPVHAIIITLSSVPAGDSVNARWEDF